MPKEFQGLRTATPACPWHPQARRPHGRQLHLELATLFWVPGAWLKLRISKELKLPWLAGLAWAKVGHSLLGAHVVEYGKKLQRAHARPTVRILLTGLSFSCGASFGVPNPIRAWTEVSQNSDFQAKFVARQLALKICIAQAEQLILARFPRQRTLPPLCSQGVSGIENCNSKVAVPSPSTQYFWHIFLHVVFNILGSSCPECVSGLSTQ